MIAFLECPDPNKFHHVAFHLEGWQDVGAAADIMFVYDTRGQTIYFFDPSGNRNEVFAGGCALS
jgi:catechol 2,3-dioxygenase